MDIFNKKKLKELQQKNAEQEKIMIKYHNNLEKIAQQLSDILDENEKLIDWIYKILDNSNTYNVYDKNGVSIPIYDTVGFGYDPNLGDYTTSEITIPEITIHKRTYINK